MSKHSINRIISGMDSDDDDAPAVSQTPKSEVNENTSVPRETAAEAAARIRAERAAGTRPSRLDGFNLKLQVYGTVPGYQLSIMNDDRNRIAEAQMHGWAMVQASEIEGVNSNVSSYNTDPGGMVRFLVGTKDTNEPLYGYLMKLPQEIWDDDMAQRLAFNQRNDALIKGGGVPNENAADREQRYAKPFGVPISMETRTR